MRASVTLLLALSCATQPTMPVLDTMPADVPTPEPEPAPPASPRQSLTIKDFTQSIRDAFDARNDRRIHVQVDKPMYRPGETVWISVWDLSSQDLSVDGAPYEHLYELVNPQGAVVASKLVEAGRGHTAMQFDLGSQIAGGRYLVRAQGAERAIIVANYEPPRIKKKLDFLRDAYGAGERVQAVVKLDNATRGPLVKQPVEAVVQLGGMEVERLSLRTDERGRVVVSFELPSPLLAHEGLLTVLVDDGGVTESISRSIPLITSAVDVALFPEGGDLVEGLASRVYLAATDPSGEPVDVAGRVVDAQGRVVSSFRTLHEGRARFALTPMKGDSYTVEITEPPGVETRTPVPEATSSGCVLRSYDDALSVHAELRVGVWCSKPRTVSVLGSLRDRVFDVATVEAGPDAPAVVYLADEERLQGIARVTVFDGTVPLAERLVYRHLGRDLHIEVQPDRERYAPREEVVLTVTTTDADGEPVAGELALSVVDDTVIALADDEEGHLLSGIYLEADVPLEVDDPGFYFDPEEADAPMALDHLLGTAGYRRFDWAQLLAPPSAVQRPRNGQLFMRDDMEMEEAAFGPEVELEPMAQPKEAPMAEPVVEEVAAAPMAPARPAELKRAAAKIDLNMADMDMEMDEIMPYEVARVFPIPNYRPGYTGPRVDFRDTVFWAPSVVTDKAGVATVRFPTSDALTSFRVFADGVGAGAAGHAESVFTSSLPFGTQITLPVAVSEGDRIELPVRLSNETRQNLAVSLDADLGDLIRLEGDAQRSLSLAAGQQDTVWLDATVTAPMGESPVSIASSAGSMQDAFERTLTVTPLGFPVEWQRSGEVDETFTATVPMAEALPGTLEGTVTLYPSPVATMTQGMSALLREPGGCFEQTSSSNYPNVMVLRYLEEHGVQDAELLQRSTGLLERGYGRLVSFESPKKGYEWFGGDPGHEALTAYGLLEFKDMSDTWGGVDTGMMERTANWLKSRRDGKGGYERDPQALDSFGRASPEVTDAYITWALSEAGFTDMPDEIARAETVAAQTDDAYLLALSAKTLLNSERASGASATKRLVAMQDKDGSFPGADHSITRSGGENLLIETTSLAVLTMLQAGGLQGEVQSAVAWLNDHRGGFGQWGSTQATVLALQAMAEYARSSRRTRSSGEVELWVNGDVYDRVAYAEGHQGALVFSGFGGMLRVGDNTIEVRHRGGDPLPVSVAVDYRSTTPASSPDAVVDLQTELSSDTVALGETVRLTATVRNTTSEGQPMTLARIGYPGGLMAQGWQLEELRERGVVAFYETRPREVTLYFRDLEPEELKTVHLDLTAEIPGTTTGPASRAYLYYTDEHKVWDEGVQVTVTR